MKVAYYPGCSLEGTARDYAESILGICASLGIQLEEVPDWNCCGATAAHSIDHQASIDLAGRILKLATQMPHPDMLVPCPMCFNRLKRAVWALQGLELPCRMAHASYSVTDAHAIQFASNMVFRSTGDGCTL